MQVTNITDCLPNKKYISRPAFRGTIPTNTSKVVKSIHIGDLNDGYIGKIAIKKANGIKDFLSVEKQTSGKLYETYSFKNDKEQLVGIMELSINKCDNPYFLGGKFCTNHIYISNLRNYSAPRIVNYNRNIEEYKGVGTKLLQIALQRSEEENCNGDVELFSTEYARRFYKLSGFDGEYSLKDGMYKMWLPYERMEFLRQKNGGVELILPDNRVVSF